MQSIMAYIVYSILVLGVLWHMTDVIITLLWTCRCVIVEQSVTAARESQCQMSSCNVVPIAMYMLVLCCVGIMFYVMSYSLLCICCVGMYSMSQAQGMTFRDPLCTVLKHLPLVACYVATAVGIAIVISTTII